jgi:plasmid stabilization system protein ParE
LCFVMGPYLVDYAISGDEIRIFAIRHGRQRPPGVALDDDFDFEGA